MTSAAASAVLLGLTVRGLLPGLVACTALVPLLIAVRREEKFWRAGAMTLLANQGILAAAYEGSIPVLPWAFPAVLFLAAPGAMFPGLLHALLLRAARARADARYHVMQASAVTLWSIPFTWTASEFLASRRWLWGQFASPVALGYTQLDSPLLPFASLVGVTGVTLAVVAFNVMLAQALLERRSVLSLVPVVLIALVSLPLSYPSEASRVEQRYLGSEPTVAIVQPALHNGWYEIAESEPQAREHILAQLTELTANVEEADLIVWPEGVIPRETTYSQLARHLELLDLGNSELIAGALSERDEGTFNSAIHVHAATATAVFDKLAPVPIGEASISPGERLVIGNWGGLLTSPLICLDSLYGIFSSRLASLGSDLLVVLSNDSFAQGMATAPLHLRASRFRAVETGLPLIFASAWGPSAVVNPHGDVVAQTVSNTATTLIATLPASGAPTPYVRWGEWAGQLSTVVTTALLLVTHATLRGFRSPATRRSRTSLSS